MSRAARALRRARAAAGGDTQSQEWSAARLRAVLKEDLAFRVTSMDGMHWIEPFTGRKVLAGLNQEQAAIEWLVANKPWRTRPEPLGLPALQIRRWQYHLREHIPEERRFRLFRQDGLWLNPYTGGFIKGIRRPQGSIDANTVRDMARALAACPEAASSQLQELNTLLGILQQANRTIQEQTPGRPVQTLHDTGKQQVLPARHASDDATPLTVPRLPALADDGEPAASTTADFGHYRIRGRMGQGWAATVYQAIDRSSQQEVALKIFDTRLECDSAMAREFLDLGAKAATVDHPNLARVHAAGAQRRHVFIALEFVPGGDLEQWVEENDGHLAEAEALRIIHQACLGLEALHQAGVIHGDIKPSNILLTDDGSAKLGDFGLARTLAAAKALSGEVAEEGEVWRRRRFMAPEQASDLRIDERTDVYGLGITLYALLSGQSPPQEPKAQELAAALQAADPVPQAETIRLIARACARDVTLRPQSAHEMAQALARCLEMLSPSPAAAQAAEEQPPSAAPAADVLLIRECRLEDVPTIARLQRQCEAEDLIHGFRADSEADWTRRLGAFFLVAEIERMIVGYATASIRSSEGLAVIPQGQAFLEVNEIYVMPEQRRRQVGGKLVDRLLERAAAAGIQRFLVYSASKDTEAVLRFYGSHGFKPWFVQLYR